MNKDWILQANETRRTYSNATWVPLRASCNDETGDVQHIGHVGEYFGCGSVAFPPEHRAIADGLGWMDIGISHGAKPYAYDDGYYAPIEQYQRNDKEPIGVHLVFDHPQPVVGGTRWILSPDLIVALRLVKEGNDWVRPEENFVVVVREVLSANGDYRSIEIKREFLNDYLAARNLALRISYYRQRVENVETIEGSAYATLADHEEERNGGRFELLIRTLNDVYGGSWAAFRVWRTDIDAEEDAPVMGPESDDNTESESSRGHRSGLPGIRVEGEFRREEWIDHQGRSARVRGDAETNLPQFIVSPDGTRMASAELNDEDIGRWLWFRTSVVNELLSCRGFELKWYTAETGGIRSTSGGHIHFGLNTSDLLTIYACDIARLAGWEQHIWAAHNVVPEGKVSSELFSSHVSAKAADTRAVETILFECILLLEREFRKKYEAELFSHKIDDATAWRHISRFESRDQASLLRLAKELIRVFSDRLNVGSLRKLATHAEKDKLGSNKLLQDVLAQKVGAERAREVFGPIAGTYDMRLGDAHPTSSKIQDALTLVGIDESRSHLRQGEQLISKFAESIWWTGKLLFGEDEKVPSTGKK